MQAKFYEPKNKDGKIQAFADVDIVEGVTVRGFRVVNGDNGLFAALPSRPVTVDGQTRYMNQLVFADGDRREAFLKELLAAYASWRDEARSERSSA